MNLDSKTNRQTHSLHVIHPFSSDRFLDKVRSTGH
jgi:hypothetical protein